MKTLYCPITGDITLILGTSFYNLNGYWDRKAEDIQALERGEEIRGIDENIKIGLVYDKNHKSLDKERDISLWQSKDTDFGDYDQIILGRQAFERLKNKETIRITKNGLTFRIFSIDYIQKQRSLAFPTELSTQTANL